MRKLLIILLVFTVMLAGCLGSDTDQQDMDTQSPPLTVGPGDEIPGKSQPSSGDIVMVDYIMRAEGKIVDATDLEAAKKSTDFQLINSLHSFGFEPFTFIIGSGFINPIFSNSVRDMKVGEKRNITIPPEDSIGGLRQESLVQMVERSTLVPITETIPTELFRSGFDKDPSHGEKIELDYWNSTVVGADETTTTIRHDPVNGSIFEQPAGNISIHHTVDMITMEFIPLINVTTLSVDGRYITILRSNETHMLVDYNHPLAGRSLDVEIILRKVSEPIRWHEDLDTVLSESMEKDKPVLLLFTNTSCVTYRRIELEILTNPIPLSLHDKFVFVKIDTEKDPLTAQKYDVTNLPVTIILKGEEEKTRITDFLPPVAMRVEMESTLN